MLFFGYLLIIMGIPGLLMFIIAVIADVKSGMGLNSTNIIMLVLCIIFTITGVGLIIINYHKKKTQKAIKLKKELELESLKQKENELKQLKEQNHDNFCTYCGAKLDEDNICHNCGATNHF